MLTIHRAAPAVLAGLLLLAGRCPAGEAARPLQRIAFGSCSHQNKPLPIFDAVAAAKPDLFLHLGDVIYADTQDMQVMKAKYDKLAALPGWQKLLRTCPVFATWDDHDFGANDAGREYPRKVESQKLFLDFFKEPPDSPRRRRPGVYDARVYGPPGKQVQVILLDTRYFRSPLKKKAKFVREEGPYVANTDPEATVLGAEQWKWLEEQLRVPAQVRLLGSSIQLVAEDHGFEKWMNFPLERQRFLKLLRDTRAGGVVVLSGDRHLAELSLLDGPAGYPLYDLTSSGFNQASRTWRPPEVNRHRVATMPFGNNFGMVLIDWDRPDPRLRLQIRDEDGEVTIQHKIDLSLLRPPTAAGPGAVTTAEAASRVNEKVTVQLQVKSAGATKDGGRVFLNSAASFRDRNNFTVVLDKEGLAAFRQAGVADPKTHFQGKTVRVTGTVTLFNERPQIIVSDPKQIQIVSD
jgi:alkaline phosphatase D